MFYLFSLDVFTFHNVEVLSFLKHPDAFVLTILLISVLV